MTKTTFHAHQALNLFAIREGSCSGGDPTRVEDYQCDLVDLITDLLHLADELDTQHGLLGSGGEATAASALGHYRDEKDDR